MAAGTQRAQILNHLQSGASLTQCEALNLYGVGRLAARIQELRAEGHDIQDLRSELKANYSVYWLRTGEGQGSLMPLPMKGRPE